MKEQHDPIKKSVESFRPDFDKQALWNAIQTQIEEPKKKKKNRWFILLFWITGFSICAGMTWWWMTPKHQKATIAVNNIPDSLSEIYDEQTTISLVNDVNKNDAIEKTSISLKKEITKNPSFSNSKNQSTLNKSNPHLNNIATQKQVSNPSFEKEIIYIKADLLHQKQKTDPTNPSINTSQTKQIQSLVKQEKILKLTLQAQLLSTPIMEKRPLSDLQKQKQQFPKATGHRAIELSSYYGRTSRISKGNSTDGNQYLAAKEEMDQTLYTTGLDLKYNQQLSKNWSAQLGLHYQRITDRLKVNKINVVSNEVYSDSAFFFVYTEDKITYFPGTLTETITTTRMIQQYNHLDNLGLSVGLKWQEQLGKFSIYGSTNLAYFPWQKISGKTINQDLELVDYTDTSLSSSFNKHQLSWQIEGGLQWQINHKWILFSGLQYRQDLNARFKTSAYQHKYRSIGVTLGVTKQW